jgi:hypothetical protein
MRKKRTRATEGAAPERWNPPPPSPRAAEVAVELVPVAGADAPAMGSSMEAPAGDTVAPPEPSRKRKRGFSNLR